MKGGNCSAATPSGSGGVSYVGLVITFFDSVSCLVDNTLSLLAISACSRGLAHRLTRNLNILKRHNQALATKPDSYTQRHYWDPRLPSNSERYKPVIVLADSPPGSKADKKERWRRLDLEAWGALGEVILMAEGRDGISLGRIKSGASPLRGPDEQKQ